jgi:hypothetical protein
VGPGMTVRVRKMACHNGQAFGRDRAAEKELDMTKGRWRSSSAAPLSSERKRSASSRGSRPAAKRKRVVKPVWGAV